jgi:uncharacterized MAPEG superfamily protein
LTTELALLMWSLPVYGLYLGAQSLIYRWRFGIEFAASARDETPKPEGDLLGRAERALKNFQETWLVFVILALVAHLGDPGDAVVFWGAVIYLVARVMYLPLYLWGVYMIRSLVWNVATIGLAIMFFGILF